MRIRLHPEVAVSITVNVARSVDEAALQEKYGGTIPSGDVEPEETVEVAELLENPEEARRLEEPEAEAEEDAGTEGGGDAESPEAEEKET